MTDLRQAAQQALEALEAITRSVQSDHQAEIAEDAITALRTALEQPEQVDCPRCGHVCSQRQWQGLTPDEVKHLYPYGRSVWGKETFEAIEKALKAKNNG